MCSAWKTSACSGLYGTHICGCGADSVFCHTLCQVVIVLLVDLLSERLVIGSEVLQIPSEHLEDLPPHSHERLGGVLPLERQRCPSRTLPSVVVVRAMHDHENGGEQIM